jgi:hypothetical protein
MRSSGCICSLEGEPLLRPALSVLVDWRGRRLKATAALPIAKVVSRTPCVALLDRGDAAARALNLDGSEQQGSLVRGGAAALRLYDGTDGRGYVAGGLGQGFPLDLPRPDVSADYHCRFLRPEFVRAHSVPLSANAYLELPAHLKLRLASGLPVPEEADPEPAEAERRRAAVEAADWAVARASVALRQDSAREFAGLPSRRQSAVRVLDRNGARRGR